MVDNDMKLNHFDKNGKAIMVDVGDKEITERVAVAKGRIKVNEQVYEAIQAGTVKKGDVLGVARVAGIMGAKKTAELIPMCHLLAFTKCSIDFEMFPDSLEVEATCTIKTKGQTGVEMEALTGVNIALLTIYDMCKAIDKRMVIGNIYLYEKTGGKSGDVRWDKDNSER